MNTAADTPSNELPELKHWRLSRDADGIAWLAIDRQGESVNSLSHDVLHELSAVIDHVSAKPSRGMILYSAKPGSFIMGADIREFKNFRDPQDATRHVQLVHDLLYRLEALPFPTVARIHGYCLGGGLEIALACRYRVARDDADTRLGLPEILLGIHPGFGGTVRSVQRMGALAAMDLMLTGRNLDARRAAKAGLIDRAVPERHLDTAARRFVLEPRPGKPLPWYLRAANADLARPLIARLLRRQVQKRAAEQHYPASYATIRLWERYGGDPRTMMREEAVSIGQLFATAASRNLQRLFFLQERLKGFGRKTRFKPQHVHVIGAGTMGGDIAAWCALRGLRVTLQDREAKYIAPAIKRAHKLYQKRIRDPYERMATMDRLVVDVRGDGIRHADVIIEAISEDLEAKRELFKRFEAEARPDALLATNTSSIPLEEIAAALTDPARLTGIHFFNPVDKMQLVEIIGSSATASEALALAVAFTTRIGKLPLPAASTPGFLINRILSPYLQEAMILLEEGVSANDIDAAATDFGMPMGPLELADVVGLDICLSVGNVLAAKLGGAVPEVLKQQVAQRRLGRKTSAGFYDYKGSRLIRPKTQGRATPPGDIRDRLWLRLLNTAVACLREGVVTDADLVDVGMVFGAGFAPFRGGPINYARERGVAEVRQRLAQLETQCGERFAADAGWDWLS